jgi:hypothetical protein
MAEYAPDREMAIRIPLKNWTAALNAYISVQGRFVAVN